MIWEKFNLYPFPPKNNVAGKVGSQGTRQVSCVGVWGGAEQPPAGGVLSNFGEKNYLQKLMLTFIGAKSVTKAIKRQNLQYIKNSWDYIRSPWPLYNNI